MSLCAALAWFATGCAQTNLTNPARSATEQLLLSTAADRALSWIPLTEFQGKRVFVDGSYLESYDSKYVVGTLRDALSRAGALVQNELSKSEMVLEIRSGALSTDSQESIVGIPKTTAPVPLAGGAQIPEIALFKSNKQDSLAKLAVLAYTTDSREHVFSSGPSIGRAHNRYYKLLFFIKWTRTDLPEKERRIKLE